MEDIYKKCNLCSRKCSINRYERNGICGANDKVKIARAALHYWEEPCISGDTGSGTVFFSNCNLKCIFCQNKKISTNGFGKEVEIEELSNIYLNLQKQGANNINLVTPTHYVPSIIKSLEKAKNNGLKIPVVYNTSSYETKETMDLLDGNIDIYLPDLKYYNNEHAFNYSNVKDYFKIATNNIKEMYNQVGKNIFDENGMMIKGVIVRVLLLPNHVEDAKMILKYLYETYKDNIYISIMNQYTPIECIEKYPDLNRKVTQEEYDELINYACDLGIINAFIQEGETQSESFIPDFNLDGIS